MKTLYFDCHMGAAGDMLTAALLELVPEPEQFVEKFNALGIPGVTMERTLVQKSGIQGTQVSIKINGVEEESVDHHAHDEHHHESSHEHNHEHSHGEAMDHSHAHMHEHPHEHAHDHDHSHDHSHDLHQHRSLADIEHVVRGHLDLPQKVQDDVMAVYQLIGEAESHAHGAPITDIHFHEVGTMDAVADITAFCLLMNEINPERVMASPIHVGSGQVKCAHGILPVPAPATAYILRDVPIYGGSIEGELCTPTGAALLKHFVDEFGDMPLLKTSGIGYGMGKKDFTATNCVRAMLGQSPRNNEDIFELSCNVDDMTAEEIGFAMERLYEGGARDVYTIGIGMKKNRPGTLIHVMCDDTTREKMVELLFLHTSTLGIRCCRMDRYTLSRKIEKIETPYGEVRVKKSEGYGVERSKLEYDDLAKIAREQGMSLKQVREQIKPE